jgi:hypothetical protein
MDHNTHHHIAQALDTLAATQAHPPQSLNADLVPNNGQSSQRQKSPASALGARRRYSDGEFP